MGEIGAEARNYIAKETMISIIMASLLSAGFCFLIFLGNDPIAFWGAGGFAFDFLPQTFMIGLLGTIIPTLLTRKRTKGRSLERLPRPTPRLPRPVIVRALAIAIAGTLLFVPLTVGGIHLAGIETFSFLSALAIKVTYGAVVALLLTPLIVRQALSD